MAGDLIKMQIGTGYDDLAHWLSSGNKANAFVIHPPRLSSHEKFFLHLRVKGF